MAIEPRNPFETDDGPCGICGKAVDDCICPECPTCGGQGDPKCYRDKGHPLRLSMPQVIANQEYKIAVMKGEFAGRLESAEFFLERLREQKAVEPENYTDVLPRRRR
jgi:hypothetical protein